MDILEKARELGEMLADSEEYKRLQAAEKAKNEDEQALKLLNDYNRMANEFAMKVQAAEPTKEELETRIACEKLAKPKVSAEFMTFWLHRFRKLDVRQKSHRKMLIDTFVNAIFLYDDKMVITFNYKEGTTTITFDDLKAALDGKNTGSDLDCLTAPRRKDTRPGVFSSWCS